MLDIPLTGADPFREEGMSIIRNRRSFIRVLSHVRFLALYEDPAATVQHAYLPYAVPSIIR